MPWMNRRRPSRRVFGRFEALESRMPLAGNVTTNLDTNTGILTITGDGLDNSILFERSSDPGLYELTGLNDAATNTPTTINGLGVGVSPVFPVASIQSVTIILNDGNDQVLVKDVSLVNLTINGGNGNDRIDVGDYVPLTTPNPANNQQLISNNLNIFPGSGADGVSVNYVYNAAKIEVSKPTTGSQDNGNLNLALYVTFSDVLLVDNVDDGFANPQNPAVSNDSLSLGYVTTELALVVNTGDGNDLISYYASRNGVGIDGSIPNFISGSGDDYVALDVNIYENGVFVDAGDGTDTIQFSRAVFVRDLAQSVILFCGTGNDTLLVGKYFDAQAILRDSGSSINYLRVDLGPGNDTATIVTNIFNRFEVFMGGGNDNAYFGSNLLNSGGSGLINGDRNEQLNTSITGTDRVRRFNNTWDAFQVNYAELSIEERLFGPQ